MKTTKKLYEVTLRGFASKRFFVIAEDCGEAYSKLRQNLDDRDYGFYKDRELDNVKLIAEETDYPDCENHLMI